MNKYINKTLIRENSIDELDWRLNQEFGIDDLEDDFENELVIIENGNFGLVTSHIINIDTMIGELQQLKRDGATHVAIDYHCDHIGYDITGFLVKESTEEEITDYIFKKETKNQKESKRLNLLRQLKELDTKPSEEDLDNLPF
jgi:hypothetical protein